MQNQHTYKVLGVMSGTSLDGVDLAECYFQKLEDKWHYRIGQASTVPYTKQWKQKLQQAIILPETSLHTLNKEYTVYVAKIIEQFISTNNISQLDAVCSHGHTILHEPDKGITLQIGNLPVIAQILKQKIVCDFRTQDVALGGQGAPLVPIGDQLLFSDYKYCINLGGFANISFENYSKRIAYDICPVNIVMNQYAEMLGKPYDKDGFWASQGTTNDLLLKQLNALDFYKKAAPKSLGLEWVQKNIAPLLKHSKLNERDVLRTFVSHIAQQIALQIAPTAKVLVTGGGAYNQFLLSTIKKETVAQLVVPNPTLLEYKEALIFGFLGVLKLRGEVNCLASVTGAIKDHSSGVIFDGK